MTADAMRRLRDRVESVVTRWEARDPHLETDTTLTAVEKDLIAALARGRDPEQVKLCGDFLVLSMFERDGRRHDDAARFAREVRGRRDLIARPCDDPPDAQRYSRQAMRNRVALTVTFARSRATNVLPAEAAELAATALDNRAALANLRGEFGDPLFNVFTLLPAVARRVAPGRAPRGLRAALADLPAVAGVAGTPGKPVVFLRGRHLHAVRVDLGTRRTEALGRGEAAAAYRATLRPALAADGWGRRLHAQPYQGGFLICTARADAFVTPTQWAALKAGKPLPEGHAAAKEFSQHGWTAWVEGPLQLADGPDRRGLEAFVAALAQVYPKHRFVRSPAVEQIPYRSREFNGTRCPGKGEARVWADGESARRMAADLVRAGAVDKRGGGLVSVVLLPPGDARARQWLGELGQQGKLDCPVVILVRPGGTVPPACVDLVRGMPRVGWVFAPAGDVTAEQARTAFTRLIAGGDRTEHLPDLWARALAAAKVTGVWTMGDGLAKGQSAGK
jgi:hypothetical protein